MDFYQVLLEIMEEKSFSIPDVARATGLSDSTIRSIISRKTKKVSLDVAFKMYKGLGVSLERLNGEEIKNSSKDNNLSQEETTLLENYNKLNSKGKERLIDYSDELTTNIKYMDNSNNEITATIDNVTEVDFNSNNKEDDEEVFVPYKSLDEIDGCNAAHADNLTLEQLEHVKSIILELENKRKLEEFNKRKNK